MANLVAIVGRPNVGKSTLFNRLTNSRRAIVSETAGTTRDRQYGKCLWNGREFSLVDTGGWVVKSDDIFEDAIRKQVRVATDEADLVLFVVDNETGITDWDEDVAQILRRASVPILLVANKIDNSGRSYEAAEFYKLGLGDPICVSAITGGGTGDLLDIILEKLEDVPEEEVDDNLPRFAVVGRPNVGKSSLLNALAQEEVAIVTDIPGTTRDRIEHWVSLNGVPVKMVDTAGIRTTDDVVESKGIERTLVEIRKADVVLHLKDASGLIRDDTEVLDKVLKEVRHGVPLITVNNKVDLCESAASGGEIAISAKQGVGLSELKARLLEVVGMAATTDGVFMARERHLQCLKTAAEHVSRALLLIDCDPMPELVAEELRLASRALGEILGETTTEDILGMIFSKFCIGK